MLQTIKHQDTGKLVVVAKCLTGYLKTSDKITDADSYVKVNGTFDAEYVAYMVSWQTSHGCTPDGIIGPATWRAIAKAAPTCSTAKNRKSGYTFALQLLLDGNVTPDAIYGHRTKAAVAAYQSASGLTADGICGPKTWNGFIVGSEAPAPSKFVQPKDFKQGAKPWGPMMYSNHNDPKQTMANSGCGPTAVSDIVYTLRDNSINPYTIAQQSMAWGDRSYNNGTDWTLFKPHVADYYDFPKCIKTKTLATMKACLDAGGYVVCSMRKGYWTTGGHFITAWKYDDTDIYANDPASSKRTHQEANQFHSECKQYFCYYPERSTKATPEPETRSVTGNHDKICDVSRFQGAIDWDKLAPELAFVIIKASGLYSKGTDTRYVRNVEEAVKHGIPFHVFTYLYCKTESEAKRDAKLFYDSVVKGGHMPLFWVIDCESGWGIADKDAPYIARVFEDELRRLAGNDIKVAIYVANEKYNDWKFDYNHFAYVWIPKYTKNPPTHPCDLWQYTSTGTLPGINDNVDLDVLTGTKPMEFFTGRKMEENIEWGSEPVVPTKESHIVVTGVTVNVREKPNLSSKILGIVRKNEELLYCLTVDVDGTDWYKIEYNGKEGYISGKYSRLVE